LVRCPRRAVLVPYHPRVEHPFDYATLVAAGGYFQAAETVVQRLLTADPDAPRSQGNVSVSLNKLGDFLAGRGQPGDAEKTLGHYECSLEVRESAGAVAEPANAVILSVNLPISGPKSLRGLYARSIQQNISRAVFANELP
jgi:hypothetical protein